MLTRLAAWWRGYRVALGWSKAHCAVCREYLPPHGGGIESWNLERVCSEECAREHESHNAW